MVAVLASGLQRLRLRRHSRPLDRLHGNGDGHRVGSMVRQPDRRGPGGAARVGCGYVRRGSFRPRSISRPGTHPVEG